MKPIEILRPYIRNGAFPIDSLSLFSSYDEALEYAHSNPSAYATQIIGVDDKELRKSEIYKLIYDPNKIYNYLLERIEIGNGSSIFEFKGSVSSFTDLPEDVVQGDMYFVEDEHSFYIAFIDSQKQVQWKQLTIEIQVVSKTNDGLMPKEIYKTLYNESNSDAVYFSRKTNDQTLLPENNSWLGVKHTKKETNKEYNIPSIGLVKEILNSVIDKTLPHLTIESTTPNDNTANSFISPTLEIDFYKEFGGNPTNAKIYRYVNNKSEELVFNGIPSYTKRESVNGQEIFHWSWTDKSPITAGANSYITYRVINNYDEAEDGNLSANQCEEIKQFNFYKIISYGHNLEQYNPVFCKYENVIHMKYDPEKFANSGNHIKQIFINIPKEATLESIEYAPQHDQYAKNLFKEIVLGDGSKRYEYTLFGNLYFRNPGEFIFKVIL